LDCFTLLKSIDWINNCVTPVQQIITGKKKNIARRKLLKKVEKPIEGKRDTMEMGFWGRMAD
jgi:hypothetical protein